MMVFSFLIKLFVSIIIGLFFGVAVALILWITGNNPYRYIENVTVYNVKPPSIIKIGEAEKKLGIPIYVYKYDNESKYFIIVTPFHELKLKRKNKDIH